MTGPLRRQGQIPPHVDLRPSRHGQIPHEDLRPHSHRCGRVLAQREPAGSLTLPPSRPPHCFPRISRGPALARRSGGGAVSLCRPWAGPRAGRPGIGCWGGGGAWARENPRPGGCDPSRGPEPLSPLSRRSLPFFPVFARAASDRAPPLLAARASPVLTFLPFGAAQR